MNRNWLSLKNRGKKQKKKESRTAMIYKEYFGSKIHVSEDQKAMEGGGRKD